MSESNVFLKAICDNPDDDGPRLIYADWLEENGNLQRAEFIRVQCALARMRKDDPQWNRLCEQERELLKTHWVEWVSPVCELFGIANLRRESRKPFWYPSRWFHVRKKKDTIVDRVNKLQTETLDIAPPFRLIRCLVNSRTYWISPRSIYGELSENGNPELPIFQFKRGFIDRLDLIRDREDILEPIEKCCSITPLTTLELTDSGFGTINRFVQSERFLQIRDFNFMNSEQDTIHAILESPYIVQLERLGISSSNQDFSFPLSEFARCRYFHQLRELWLYPYFGLIVEDEFRELINSPLIGQLQKLSLVYIEFSDEGATIILESNRFRDSKCILKMLTTRISPESYSRLKAEFGDRFKTFFDQGEL
jgi:uncharacterized protein (TIGR02996 family)